MGITVMLKTAGPTKPDGTTPITISHPEHDDMDSNHCVRLSAKPNVWNVLPEDHTHFGKKCPWQKMSPLCRRCERTQQGGPKTPPCNCANPDWI